MRTRILLLFACSLVFAQPDANPQQQTPPQTYPATQQQTPPQAYPVPQQQQNNSPVMYGTYVQYNAVPPAFPDSIAKREAAIKDSIAAERAKEEAADRLMAASEDVVWNQMKSSSLFAGFHISFGLAGIYNSEKVKGQYTPGSNKTSEADPFKGTIGFNFDLGLAGMYRPIKYAGLYLEADFWLSYFTRESDEYCKDVKMFGKTKCEPLDEDFLLIGFDFPLLLRIYPTRNFFLEAGPSLRLNVYGSRSLSEDTDWSLSTSDDERRSWRVGLRDRRLFPRFRDRLHHRCHERNDHPDGRNQSVTDSRRTVFPGHCRPNQSGKTGGHPAEQEIRNLPRSLLSTQLVHQPVLHRFWRSLVKSPDIFQLGL